MIKSGDVIRRDNVAVRKDRSVAAFTGNPNRSLLTPRPESKNANRKSQI